jgi:hypothetical protein
MTDPQHEVRLALVEQNYQNLDNRLGKVEEKIDGLHRDIKDSNASLIKVIVGAAGTITAGLLSTIIVLLMKF